MSKHRQRHKPKVETHVKHLFRWYYYRKGKRHLTKKAKLYLGSLARARKIEKEAKAQHRKDVRELKKNNLKTYTYHIKLIYKSWMSGKDNILEFMLEITSQKEPSESQVNGFISRHMISLANELGDDFITQIPYNKSVVGLSSVKLSNSNYESFRFRNVRYSHHL